MSYMDKRSGKRFHRKLFSKHVVNDYFYQREENKLDPKLTNKRRHEIRAEARRDVLKMRKDLGI